MCLLKERTRKGGIQSPQNSNTSLLLLTDDNTHKYSHWVRSWEQLRLFYFLWAAATLAVSEPKRACAFGVLFGWDLVSSFYPRDPGLPEDPHIVLAVFSSEWPKADLPPSMLLTLNSLYRSFSPNPTPNLELPRAPSGAKLWPRGRFSERQQFSCIATSLGVLHTKSLGDVKKTRGNQAGSRAYRQPSCSGCPFSEKNFFAKVLQFFLFISFLVWPSVCSQGWPRTFDPPASIFWVLGL